MRTLRQGGLAAIIGVLLWSSSATGNSPGPKLGPCPPQKTWTVDVDGAPRLVTGRLRAENVYVEWTSIVTTYGAWSGWGEWGDTHGILSWKSRSRQRVCSTAKNGTEKHTCSYLGGVALRAISRCDATHSHGAKTDTETTTDVEWETALCAFSMAGDTDTGNPGAGVHAAVYGSMQGLQVLTGGSSVKFGTRHANATIDGKAITACRYYYNGQEYLPDQLVPMPPAGVHTALVVVDLADGGRRFFVEQAKVLNRIEVDVAELRSTSNGSMYALLSLKSNDTHPRLVTLNASASTGLQTFPTLSNVMTAMVGSTVHWGIDCIVKNPATGQLSLDSNGSLVVDVAWGWSSTQIVRSIETDPVVGLQDTLDLVLEGYKELLSNTGAQTAKDRFLPLGEAFFMARRGYSLSAAMDRILEVATAAEESNTANVWVMQVAKASAVTLGKVIAREAAGGRVGPAMDSASLFHNSALSKLALNEYRNAMLDVKQGLLAIEPFFTASGIYK